MLPLRGPVGNILAPCTPNKCLMILMTLALLRLEAGQSKLEPFRGGRRKAVSCGNTYISKRFHNLSRETTSSTVKAVLPTQGKAAARVATEVPDSVPTHDQTTECTCFGVRKPNTLFYKLRGKGL